jgi:gamma-glutamyltranspeptidase
VLAEADLPDDVRDRLAMVGMPFDTLAPRDESVGHAHLLRRIDDRWHAGSDPRADGAAIAG